MTYGSYIDSFFYLNNFYNYENIIIGDILRVRLGYACICNAINDTTSSPYTYSEYLKNGDLDKLDKVIISNLNCLSKIIDYNIKNNIHFYRMSSKIIPLATKDDVQFDYIVRYKKIYKSIGKKINDSNMRVDFHPDQFCVINSTKKDVLDNSFKILNYHYMLLEAIGVKDKLLVIHVGCGILGKGNSIKRFINNFNKLPVYLKNVIAIENDDKLFNCEDVCYLSSVLNIPIVLDYHHYLCNKSELNIKKIFGSWNGKVPKLHYSSPKNSRDYRSHSEYIDSDEFICFVEKMKCYNRDIDVMIEAKGKDDAVFRLIREIKYKTNYIFVDDTTFYV